MKKLRVILISMFLITVGLTVGGCTLFDENLGSKVELNKSAQVTNPDAVEEQGPGTTLEGQKAEKLMSRYRQEKAEAPTERLLKDAGDD